MEKAAVIPASGIGDALLMMIASEQLAQAGYQVTTYHPALAELKEWFPKGHQFEEKPSANECESIFSSYDLIVLENDNSPFSKQLVELSKSRALKKLSLFYPTYSLLKHGPLSLHDYVFEKARPMVENIAVAIGDLLGLQEISKDNGLKAPSPLMHRKFDKRIILHPLSSRPEKNWSAKSYLKVARQLQKKGYAPIFMIHEEEKWLEKEDLDLPIKTFSTLDELASFIFESGALIGNDSLLGHLASNLGLPTLIIADDQERMDLWRPGWQKGAVVTPMPWIKHMKWLKFKKRHWQAFILPCFVLSRFEDLMRSFESRLEMRENIFLSNERM